MSATRLTTLLCSRLCHDLVSPVGAVNNGLEMLAEETDPAMREQAMKLVVQSAAEAARRLWFFRLAFGAAGAAGDQIAIDEGRKAAEGMFVTGRVRLDWPSAGANLDKGAMKLLLNLVLVAAAALPKGGEVKVRIETDGSRTKLGLTAAGSGARHGEEAGDALAGSIDETVLDGRSAVHHFVRVLASDLGAKLESHEQTDLVEIVALVPKG